MLLWEKPTGVQEVMLVFANNNIAEVSSQLQFPW